MKVSPSRILASAIPTLDKTAAVAGSMGYARNTAAVVSVKATGRQVPKAEPEGAMPHPADLTEKVSAAPMCDAIGRGAAIPDASTVDRDHTSNGQTPMRPA